jgi:urease accessory protein
MADMFPETQVIFIESGGDNLASTFSLDLVDYWLFVIDTGGGDDIPRKKGPGIIRCDLLVINKIDIAPHVGVDLDLMLKEAMEVRSGRPVVLTDCKRGVGIDTLINQLAHDVLFSDA